MKCKQPSVKLLYLFPHWKIIHCLFAVKNKTAFYPKTKSFQTQDRACKNLFIRLNIKICKQLNSSYSQQIQLSTVALNSGSEIKQ